ncbi:MAG: hypothetical protein ACREJB_13055, partial [Planctomycetaceae bacterium]
QELTDSITVDPRFFPGPEAACRDGGCEPSVPTSCRPAVHDNNKVSRAEFSGPQPSRPLSGGEDR